MQMGIFFICPWAAEAGEIIRVLILRDISRFTVLGQQMTLRDLHTGQTLFKKHGSFSLNIERKANHVRIRKPAVSRSAFLLTSPAPLQINGRQYRDKLKIFPGVNGDLWVINELSLEDYLTGVINSEIYSQWPLEAVKAQAVVARTYAVFQKRNRAGTSYDVEAGVSDQVYGGMTKEDVRARQAVKETEGELLLYRGEPIFAVYHSCCGGQTETPESLWAGNFPYLRSTACNFCLDSPRFLWNYQVSEEDLRKALANAGFGSSPLKEIEIIERSESRRVLQLLVQDEDKRKNLSGKEFRQLLGYDFLRSTNFIINRTGETFSFSGLGWGHGVGLCQWGAKGMAEGGAKYQDILKYYYQNVDLRKVRP